MMLEKETQQCGGRSAEDLPRYHVLPESDMSLKQASGRSVTRSLQVFDQFKPHILWVIIVAVAIYNYFHPSDTGGLIGFLVLISAAAGSISLPQAIDFFLRGRSASLLLEEKGTDCQPEKAQGCDGSE